MTVRKPPAVEVGEFKSAKWDELTQGRAFRQSDAPTLAPLCQWHKIAQLAQDERTPSASTPRTATTWAT